MIDVTVRTLDSQNHDFSVEEQFTVLQFKQHIAETVNIPADTQRIIYCGRVLSDDSKLIDLDVHGKVVHLVARPPPLDNQIESDSRESIAPGQPHIQQRVLGGNAMYLGSMAIPVEPQSLLPPPPTSRLAASRLNLARRMLRRIDATIALLENPSARSNQSAPSDDVQVEVTPVFEARVLIPASDATGDIDPNAATVNEQDETADNSTTNITTPVVDTSTSATETESAEANFSPDGASTPTSTSSEDLAADAPRQGQSQAANSNAGQESVSRTLEMAELLEQLGRLQQRFAPFLERYQTFLRDDPVVSAEDVRNTDRMFNRVSEILHYLGHAYHSLSDMILRVRSAPPRRLVCRPIVIQQTAVMPQGFPIQVEAQINFESDPIANRNSNNASSTAAATDVTGTPTEASAGPTPPAGAGPAAAATNTTSGHTPTSTANRATRVTIPQFEFMNLPNLHSLPIGIRTMRSGVGSRPASTDASHATQQDAGASPGANQASSVSPNIEFFMEVTPDSITIDSLESTLLGGAQTDGARAHTTPEFLQSIMQMAGQMVQRGASTSNITVSSQTPLGTDSSAAATQAQQPQQNNANSGRDSQARGNTQTHPTTSTHTRSTARPHVHFAQHTIQGFDPFLPCNSHHIVHLRRQGARMPAGGAMSNNNNSPRPQNGNTPASQMNPVINLVQGVLNSLQNVVSARRVVQTQPPSAAANVASSPPSSGGNPLAGPAAADRNVQLQQMQQTFLANLPSFLMAPMQNVNFNDGTPRGPTIEQLLQQSGDQMEGEGLFNDIIMLLSRNLTISDLIQLNAGRLDPLIRIRNDLRVFVSDRILEGNPATPANIERAVDKLLNEMQPFLAHLSHLPVHGDIDVVRSTQMLFRTRLPSIINLAVSRRPPAMRRLVDQLKLICKHFCALILHASSNGQRGVEEVMNRIIATIDNTSPDIHHWTQIATRMQLHDYLQTISVPACALQPYIVRNVDSVTASASSDQTHHVQLMDVENADTSNEFNATASNVLGAIDLDGMADMPAVVVGSETWHEEVPSEWVPLIARDSQRQRRQNEAPLSDGYLSGMPSKRRKVIASNKPQGTLPQVISESIRQAVTTTGLGSVANLEAVAQEAGADLAIQAAYRDLLRNSVQGSIQNNTDFTPERFPNASLYFNKSQ